MGEYIEREAVLAEYDRQHQGPPGGARKIIAEWPAADVVPVRHGVWRIKHFIFSNIPIARCSLCGEGGAIDMDYCPGCGARMEGDEEDE